MEDGFKQEVENLRSLWITYYTLGEPKKEIKFLERYLAKGKEIEDPRLIRFCEHRFKELEGSDD